MKFVLLLVAGLLSSGQLLHAQSTKEAEHHHDHHKNEIGIANSPVYFINEKELAYGLHLHYVRAIRDTKFGVGLGYERIFDEHKHNTIGVVGAYSPVEQVTLNLSPGVSFEDAAGSAVHFACHLEATYNIEIKNVHLGPVIEFAYDEEDYHISLGLHVGFGF